MKIAFTGHRPNKLGGYISPNPIQQWVCWCIEDELSGRNGITVISGMALGVDQWAARIAVKLGIPFIAAVPFKGQESAWPLTSRRTYHKLLKKAAQVVIVSDGEYSAQKMQIRNEWMVDNCDVLVAVWDGTPGGTGNCVRYAEKQGKNIIRINP
jgi:uncharacterized phage-like protein YoqJ